MAAVTMEVHPENPKAAKEASNSLASLQVLTSSIPPTLSLENATSGSKVEVKVKRTRKKKVPSKVGQKPILPKMFAIQIAPQASVIAPLPPVMNPAVIQTSARLAGPVTFQPQTQVLPVTTTKSIAIPLDPSTCSKTMTKASKQAKTREESIELAGKFHYASNGKEPGQCESQDLVLNSGGLPARHRSRLVHNATEKRRKEKINGWIGKIATVLFKYSPEKQHKIYILEKAYDFIAEKNRPHLETNEKSGNEKQDAFTQSESANEDTLPDLVAKIAELENLVSTLLKVIEKYKIPIPSCLFKSEYTKSKFEAIRAAYSYRVLEGFSDNRSKNDNVHDELSVLNTNRNCIAAGMQLDVPINMTAAAHSPIYSLQVQPNTTNTTHIQSSCEMVTVVNDSRNLPPCTQPSSAENELAPDVGSLTTTGVSMRLSGTPVVSASDVRPLVQMSSISQTLSSNAQVKQPVNGQEVVSLPVQQQNRSFISLPNNSLASVNASAQSLSSGQEAGSYIQQNGHFEKSRTTTVGVTQNVPRLRNEDALGANDAASVSDSIPVTTAAPTMESQMFVMKNLVHPRSKNVDCGLGPSQDNVAVRSTGGKNNIASNGNVAQSNIENSASVVSIKDRKSSQLVSTIPQTSSSVALSNVYSQVRLSQTNTAVQNNASFVRVATSLSVSGFSSNVQQLDPGVAVDPSRTLLQQNYAVNNVQRFANTSQSIAAMSNIVACSLPAASTATMRQTRTMVSNQNGAGSTQTCHSVTSLLGSSTTSPTENQTLSIEAILANTSTGMRQTENQLSLPSKRATSSENNEKNSKQTNKFVNRNLSNVEIISRKRSTAARDQNIQNHIDLSHNVRLVNSVPNQPPTNQPNKPPAKRPRRNAQMHHTENRLTNTAPSRSAGQITSKTVPTQVNPSRSNSKMAKQNEERCTLKKQPISNNSSISTSRRRNNASLPKPQNFVSLARKNPSRKQSNNGLGFSAEALIRSNNLTTAAQQSALNDPEQEMALPTILNIFAPASVGNMVSQLPVSNNTSNIQNQANNSTFPTIQSTFSNFSAEALIGGTMESQSNVSAVINAVQNVSENTLGQQEQQSLFTDFSTDALLAGTESSLSYGIDNIMSRNDVVASNSCISPNWLQNGSFIDNSPIRGSFNPGFNLFDTPNGFQGHMSLTSNSNFSTPIKWRQDVSRIEEQGHVALSSALTANGQLWSPTIAAVPHSKTRGAQAKEKQRSKVLKNQPNSNSKRGPSYGDFLLVDSVS